jgi:ornithine cyclodeaminase/alanine dehydrogenase-like protein (mu-crystallin family)
VNLDERVGSGHLAAEEITLFKSLGMAVEDVAAAEQLV